MFRPIIVWPTISLNLFILCHYWPEMYCTSHIWVMRRPSTVTHLSSVFIPSKWVVNAHVCTQSSGYMDICMKILKCFCILFKLESSITIFKKMATGTSKFWYLQTGIFKIHLLCSKQEKKVIQIWYDMRVSVWLIFWVSYSFKGHRAKIDYLSGNDLRFCSKLKTDGYRISCINWYRISRSICENCDVKQM